MTRYFDAELIGKYSQSGPRYTSYPTAVEFHERFSAADYVRHLEAGNAAARDISPSVNTSAITAAATKSSPATTTSPTNTSTSWSAISPAKRRT